MSDCNWDERDDNELMISLQKQKEQVAAPVEYIVGLSSTEEILKQQSLTAAPDTRSSIITTTELKKIFELSPLDAFLSAYTCNGFLTSPLSTNDDMERVLLYLQILTMIFELELPGFMDELLSAFVNNNVLLNHLLKLFTRLLSNAQHTLWTDEKTVEIIFCKTQKLIQLSQQYKITSKYLNEFIVNIKKLMKINEFHMINQKQMLIDLRMFLEHVIPVTIDSDVFKGSQILDKQIYPTLEELFENSIHNALDLNSSNVSDYINLQKQQLREDFVMSLQACVQELKAEKTFRTFPHLELYHNVYLELNQEFVNAHRHQMVFANINRHNSDVHSQETKQFTNRLEGIKIGTLLCLSSSTDFENLIFATVTYTDKDMLKKGCIGIEILQQYNIGNIYQKLYIMFETPEFFEPYNNVYNFLNFNQFDNLPMKEYIVDGETKTKEVEYMKDAEYTYNNRTFNPRDSSTLPKDLPLNESQRVAYCNALTNKLCLIQGPPGTGKTHLSVQLVRTLIENCSKPIVLITYTNESLDKFLINLSTYTESIVRFGSQTRLKEIMKFNIRNIENNHLINPRLKSIYFDTNEEFKRKFTILQNLHNEFDGTDESYHGILQAQNAVQIVRRKLDTIRLMFQYYVAREKSIIAMTTTCAAKTNFLFRFLKNPIVIFEEAAEILESHVLACLTPYTQHVIMIGDHMQLKPFTSSYQLTKSAKMRVSLFERLINQNIQFNLLNIQYRMCPEIADLIHPIIYESLKNDSSVERYPSVRKMTKNIYFMTHNKRETKSENDYSVYNAFEVDEIARLANYLIDEAKYNPSDLVILSPYAQQVALIESKTKINTIKVSTVDSFQGLESNIVLLSLVRTHKHIGFLKHKNRICVALSRAKHGLYMIGNIDLLANCSDTWKAIKEKLSVQDAIGTTFPYTN